MLGCGRELALQIHLVIARFTLPREIDQALPRVAPHRIEHFAADSKLRVSRKRYSPVGPEGSRRLQQTDIPRLHQIRHLDTTPSRKTRVDPARKCSNEAAHIFNGRCCHRSLRGYAGFGRIRDLYCP